MQLTTREQWDRTSRTYDFITRGEDWRQGEDKRRLFAKIRGKTLLLAVGTGNDLKYLPPNSDITAIDISPRMLTRAQAKAAHSLGAIKLLCMDAQHLAFPDHTFDTALTVCTFCSVPNPIQGLRELYRVLKPDGQLLMFEHVRSKIGPFALLLDFMTFLSRKLSIGPDLNRDTIGNVLHAGFHLRREENVGSCLSFVRSH
jgi:ubiquinone/menaquinone biosynthesis C-methylase UbiE